MGIDQGRMPIMEWIGPGPILFIMMIGCQTLLSSDDPDRGEGGFLRKTGPRLERERAF